MMQSTKPHNRARTKVLASIAVALWAVAAVAAINAGFYQPGPGELPLNLIIGRWRRCWCSSAFMPPRPRSGISSSASTCDF